MWEIWLEGQIGNRMVEDFECQPTELYIYSGASGTQEFWSKNSCDLSSSTDNEETLDMIM